MTTIPSGPSTNKPVTQPIPREQMPAFSTNSDVKYTLKMPGLDINIVLAPCKYYYTPGQVKDFTLNYDPSRFWTGSLIRRAFGTQKLSYTSEDVRLFSDSHLLGRGDMFEVYLRHPTDVDRTLYDGPLMMINRENGRIYLYTPYTDVDHPTPLGFARGILTETQQVLGKKFDGKWEKVHNLNS